MIAIIDYGAGNLGSVYKAFRFIGTDVQVTSDHATVERADGLVLPGVGAFTHCMQGLETVGLTAATKDFIGSGRPFLGICVGLQMLFDESAEMGTSPGLGVLPGRVVRFDFPETEARVLKVPHIGWNALAFGPEATLFRGLNQGDRAYFVHSYYPAPAEPSVVSATTDYGGAFCCAVERGNIHATQFHPEKSGAVGLHMLRNFAALCS
jgi:imidazole glycerol-phosphate synthase subunit HisH